MHRFNAERSCHEKNHTVLSLALVGWGLTLSYNCFGFRCGVVKTPTQNLSMLGFFPLTIIRWPSHSVVGVALVYHCARMHADPSFENTVQAIKKRYESVLTVLVTCSHGQTKLHPLITELVQY